jgi:hypothetical protein
MILDISSGVMMLQVCTLGLTALLSVPDAALPASVQASKGLLLLGLVKMLTAHR